MVFDDALDIAAIASGAALAVVFITCLAFSAWICYRMHQDDGGYFTSLKERWRKKRLRAKLDAEFKKSSRIYSRKLSKNGGFKPFDEDDYACAVCLESYTSDPCEVMVALLPKCKHYFHFECLWTWIGSHSTCPICRKDISYSSNDLIAVCFTHILHEIPESVNEGYIAETTFSCEDDSQSGHTVAPLNTVIYKLNDKDETEAHIRVFHTTNSSQMESLPAVE